MDGTAPPTGPLSGVLAADLSSVLAGPCATMLLADLGADVVEGRDGDDTRSWTPPVHEGVSTPYLGTDRGKRSIALDLRDEGDAAPARELARELGLCDVLAIPGAAADPRWARNADRTADRESLRPLLVERLALRGALEWFDLLVAAGVPCGPITTVDGGFPMAERFGLDPVAEVGEGDRAVPTTRHPIRFSATPATYRLPPPELDEHGAELRAWLSAPPAVPGA